ncbi:DUF3575 domain-containing protein [Parabacteroides sp. OttesenSCG-928-G06]|nr:DUF3575 domain-containing protein [Parabacteroides sp. OttesenSCG-928-G06]
MKKIGFIVFCCLVSVLSASAQYVAIKTNGVYDALTCPNLGVEFSMGKHFTGDVSGNYAPFEITKKESLKHWLVQPEFRYWPVERFNGHFIGLHGYYMDYVFKKVDLPFGMNKDHAYDGTGYGGGISYGYQLYLSSRWSLEFTAGFGYGYFEYDKFVMKDDQQEYLGLFKTDYWGITKAGITITYFIK